MGRPIKAHRIWRPVNRSNRVITFKLLDFLVKTTVTGQTGPVNRSNLSVYRLHMCFWIWIWIQPVSTGYRSNRSGKPVPEDGGYAGPVGF